MCCKKYCTARKPVFTFISISLTVYLYQTATFKVYTDYKQYNTVSPSPAAHVQYSASVRSRHTLSLYTHLNYFISLKFSQKYTENIPNSRKSN